MFLSPIDAPLPRLPAVNKPHLQNKTQVPGHRTGTGTLYWALRSGPEARIWSFENALHSTPRQDAGLLLAPSGSAGRAAPARLTSEQRGRKAAPSGQSRLLRTSLGRRWRPHSGAQSG